MNEKRTFTTPDGTEYVGEFRNGKFVKKIKI